MAKVRDRFDALKREPGRVGSHRGPTSHGRGWLGLVLFLVGLVVVTSVGLFFVDRVMRDSSPTGQGLDFNFPFLPEIVPTPTPTVTPTADPVAGGEEAIARGLQIMVINGTPIVGLQNTVGDALYGAGWPIGTRATAGERDELDSIVYYTDPANADVARGLVAAAGVGEIRLISPDVYPGQSLIFVIGKDHPSCLADPACAPPPPTEEPTDASAG